MQRINGILYGLLSSASFGLIPLFALPVMLAGMEFESVLMYRFLLATIMMGGIMLFSTESFRITWKDLLPLLMLAVLYMMSALLLFWGYKLMSSGVATTLHFMYPVVTTIIMMVFFHEKASKWRLLAIALAIIGVYLLSGGGDGGTLSKSGICIVLLSAVSYSLYLIAIDKCKVGRMKGTKLTFFVFLFGTLMLIALSGFTSGIQPIPSFQTAGNLLLLALIPTIVSNLALVQSIKIIGSSLASILGAMEPVTALCVGIVVFHEPITYGIGIGVAFIIAAVTLIIVKR